jgi:signal transduction histidine kinase
LACAVHDAIAFGLKVGEELDLATTLCREVRESRQPLVIEHASQEPQFRDHPVPKLYNFESYIAVPVFRNDGSYFGTVCALHDKPVKLHGTSALPMMKLFADLLSMQLQAEIVHAQDRVALNEAYTLAELRERFIAVLGHDLRNPLASVALGADTLLADAGHPARVLRVAERIKRSAGRMQLLVDDLLDLARGRLGGGIPLALRDEPMLAEHLRHVVDELASQHAGREIRVRVTGSGSVRCDPARIEQVLSNLLANALQHGGHSEPIEVELRFDPDAFVLTVRNHGPTRARAELETLFQPYKRAAVGGAGSGLGLGLYIVAEVAKAHGGTATVESSPDEGTCFSVTIPR